MSKQPLELECPNCRAKVLWTEDYPNRPFCSKRCQMTDFGEWANENRRISGDSDDGDALSDEHFDEY